MAYPTIGLKAVLEMNDFSRAEGNYLKAIGQMDQSTASFAKKASGIFKTVVTAVGAAGAAMGVVGAASLKLAVDSAGIPAIATSFNNLGGSIEEMVQKSGGMVRSVDLMKSFNQAAQLVSKDFAQTLPDALGYLAKVSASTGQSMAYLTESYVRGIGRMSGPILDNLAIQVDIAKATEDYAATVGKSVDSLTKQEKQMALNNQVLEKLRENTASMPEVIGTLSQTWGALTTKMLDLKDSVGAQLAPALESIIQPLNDIADTYGPKIIAWAGDLGRSLADVLPGIVEGFGSFLSVMENLVKFLDNFDIKIVAVSVGIAGMALAIAKLGGLTGIVTGLTGAFETLYLVMLMNPVFTLAAAIVAAGIAISAVAKDINDDTEAIAANTAAVVLATDGYDGYVAKQIEAVQNMNIYTGMMTDAQALHYLERENLLLSEEAYARYAATVANANPPLTALSDTMLSMGEIMRMQAADAQAAAEAWQGALARAGESAAMMNDTMAEAMSSSAFTDALTEMSDSAQEIMEDMNAGFVEIMEKGHQTQVDAQFQFNMDQTMALKEYQQQHNALMAAGKAEEAAQLTAKYQDQQAMAQYNYGIQEQLRERTILAQKITQQRAYVEELKMQYDALKIKWANAVTASESFKQLTKGEQIALLTTVLGGEKARLEVAKFYGETQVKVAHDSGVGVVRSAIDTAKAVLEAQKLMVDNAQAMLDQMQAEYDSFELEIPDLPGLALEGFGADVGEQAAKQVRETKEPLTASLDEVTRDLSSSVTELQKALAALPNIQVNEAAFAGLTRMGEIVKRAVTEVYSWFHDPAYNLKKLLDDVKEYMAPLVEVFKVLQIDMSKLPVDTTGELWDWVDKHLRDIEHVGRDLLDYLRKITGNPEWVTALEEAAAIVQNIVKVFDVLKINLISIPVSTADELWDIVKKHLVDIEHIGRELLDYLRTITGNPAWVAALAEAAAIVDNVVKVFDIIKIDLSKLMPVYGLMPKNVTDYFLQFDYIGRALLDYLTQIASREDWVLALKAAADIADNVTKVFSILKIGFGSIGTTTNFRPFDALLFLGQIEFIGKYTMDYLRKIADNPVWTKALEAAADIVDNVLKVFEIIKIDLSNIKTVNVQDGAIPNLMRDLELIGKYILDYLTKIASNASWTQALAAAAGIADNVKKVFDILKIELKVDAPGASFIPRLAQFFEALKMAAPYVQQGIEDVAAEWRDTAALTESSNVADLIKKVFSVLDLNKMINELEIQTPLKKGEHRTAFSNVVVQMFEDLKANAPIIKDGLAEVARLFGDSFDMSIEIGDKIKSIFEAIGSAVKTAVEITKVEGWNINLLLNRIADLGRAMDSIGNLSWGTPDIGMPPGLVPPGSPGTSTDAAYAQVSEAVRIGVVEGMAEEARDSVRTDALAAAVRTAILEGVDGSAIEVVLRIEQAEEERRMWSMQLGQIRRFMETITIRLDAAGI